MLIRMLKLEGTPMPHQGQIPMLLLLEHLIRMLQQQKRIPMQQREQIRMSPKQKQIPMQQQEQIRMLPRQRQTHMPERQIHTRQQQGRQIRIRQQRGRQTHTLPKLKQRIRILLLLQIHTVCQQQELPIPTLLQRLRLATTLTISTAP
jgi:hypothetical protein